jgi:4-phosphopantoate--beta-alanine ligase
MVNENIRYNVEISKDHPRYRSLVVREHMSEMVKQGIVAQTGLIAHGRGEAYDYLIGERTTGPGRCAERAAVSMLLEAKHPVITINGNSAALAGKELVQLARMIGAKVEVNLFHRTDERVEKVCTYMEEVGGAPVLGRDPDAILPGIASDRARCSSRGIMAADAVLIPLEDGDRAEALVKIGKKVIAIDLNPMSRTAQAAQVSIVDELMRAVHNMIGYVDQLKADRPLRERTIREFDNQAQLDETMMIICNNLSRKRP